MSGWLDLPRAPVVGPELTDGWGARVPDTSRPDPRRDIPGPQVLAGRRNALAQAFPDQTLVIPAGGFRTRSNDTDYRFRAHSAHVWLTGNQLPESVLVIQDGAGELFLRPRSGPDTGEFWTDRRVGEFWSGPRPSLAEAGELYGITCRRLEELPDRLARSSSRRALIGVDPAVDLLLEPRGGADIELEVELAARRRIKDDWELGQMRNAVEHTVAGFGDCIADWATVMQLGERWIEGTFDRRARVTGNGVGYSSIAAAGRHAAVLHWIDNDGAIAPSDLVLMDMGVEERSLYTADITRTVPASGRWSPAQRELYELVLAAQDAGIAALRPGRPFRAGHYEMTKVLCQGLIDLGLLRCSLDQALDPKGTPYARWVLCGDGHVLGLDVHDCRGGGRDVTLDLPLAAGQVLTVEPGLYFQAEDERVPPELRGLGIRVEDDLVVTEDGPINLSAALPRTPDAVVEWMAAGQG